MSDPAGRVIKLTVVRAMRPDRPGRRTSWARLRIWTLAALSIGIIDSYLTAATATYTFQLALLMAALVPMSMVIGAMAQQQKTGYWNLAELWKFVAARQIHEGMWFFLKPAIYAAAHRLQYPWLVLSGISVATDTVFGFVTLVIFLLTGQVLGAQFSDGWTKTFWRDWRFTAGFWLIANFVLYSLPPGMALVIPIITAVLDLAFWSAFLWRRIPRSGQWTRAAA